MGGRGGDGSAGRAVLAGHLTTVRALTKGRCEVVLRTKLLRLLGDYRVEGVGFLNGIFYRKELPVACQVCTSLFRFRVCPVFSIPPNKIPNLEQVLPSLTKSYHFF